MRMIDICPILSPLSILCVLLISLSTHISATIQPRLSVGTQIPWRNLEAKSVFGTNDRETFYYTQTLDHFNYRPDSYTTFPQRYVLDSRYWGGANTSSPIFAYLGAEQPIDNDLAVVGFLDEQAPKFNALIVFIEHRYYGQSVPFGSIQNAFSNSSTLGYFTSAQALADYAEVLVSLKKNLSADGCPVIVMGGSYGGMLASWFRLKYPHIAMGALASSAPILYFDNLTPQDQYYVVATQDFKEASKSCYNTLRRSWSKIDQIVSRSNGLSALSKKFMTCKPLQSPDELKHYLESLFTSAAQYDSPPQYPVNLLCNAVDKAPKGKSNPFSRIFAGVVALKGNRSCYDIEEIYRVTYDSLGWNWQTCTDLVIQLGRDRNNNMFPVSPFSLKDFTDSCRQRFDITVTPRPHWIVTEFGGHDIKHVLKKFGSNIIFSNGLRDPYSSGGVLESISDTIVAIYTTQGSHTLDILIPSKDDPKWLVKMRNEESKIMKKWIADYYANK